jgi:hypothetical protein
MKPRQPISLISFFILLFIMAVSFAEGQAVKTYINKNQILIGEHIRFEIKVNLAASNYRVNFNIPDSIPHFDIIDQGKYDTTDGSGVYTMRQTILFTSFDSGLWKFPSFPVTVSSPDKGAKTFFSDSFLVKVNYSPMDTTEELRDIKPVMDVFVVDRTWIYYLVGALLALLLAYFIYRYFKNREKKAPPVFNAKLSAYDEAMKALNDLLKSGNVDAKQYHSSISDIFKRYYSRKNNQNLMADTTGDVLIRLKEKGRSSDLVSSTAEVLRFGDAVKFAKYAPSEGENQQAVSSMKQIIEFLEKKS